MQKENEIKSPEIEVLPKWYETYVHANQNHPQSTYGIYILVGKEILNSLINREVDLDYVARSTLTKDQFEGLIYASIKAHTALKIPIMPEGYSNKSKSSFDPDFWFNGTWEETKRSVIRTLSYVKAGQSPWQPDKDSFDLRRNSNDPNIRDTFHIDYIKASSAHDLAFSLRRSDAELTRYIYPLISKFIKSPEYNEALVTVAKMYDSQASALETPENRELAKIRRELLSQSIKNREIKGWVRDYEKILYRNLKSNILNLCEQEGLTMEQAMCFLETTTSLHRFDIESLDKFYWTLDDLNKFRAGELI